MRRQDAQAGVEGRSPVGEMAAWIRRRQVHGADPPDPQGEDASDGQMTKLEWVVSCTQLVFLVTSVFIASVGGAICLMITFNLFDVAEGSMRLLQADEVCFRRETPDELIGHHIAAIMLFTIGGSVVLSVVSCAYEAITRESPAQTEARMAKWQEERAAAAAKWLEWEERDAAARRAAGLPERGTELVGSRLNQTDTWRPTPNTGSVGTPLPLYNAAQSQRALNAEHIYTYGHDWAGRTTVY